MKKYLIIVSLILAGLCVFKQEIKAQQILGVSEVHYNQESRTAGGYSGTYIDYRIYDYYDPWVYGLFFFLSNPESPISEGGGWGINSGFPGTPFIGYTVWFNTFNYQPDKTYCTYSTHKVIAYTYYIYGNNYYWFDPYRISTFASIGGGNQYNWYGNPFTQYYVIPRLYHLGHTEACITTPPDICTPLSPDGSGSAVPCPTVTPTPTPTPTPTTAEVKTVGFKGGFSIKRFPSGVVIENPTWTQGASTNSENYAAYEKGKETEKMKLTASFQINPAPTSGQTLNMLVKVKSGGTTIATTPNAVSVTSGTAEIDNLQVTSALEATPMVKRARYNLDWEVSFDNGSTWKTAGSSDQTIFWTYGDVVEPANCAIDSIPRNCLFTNNWGSVDYDGLLDKALIIATENLDATIQTPDAIAEHLAYKIDEKTSYNAASTIHDNGHPLYGYEIPVGVECSVNANILRGLLRSLGINNAEAMYVWGGKPNTGDKQVTSGKVYGYRSADYSVSSGSTSYWYYTFQAIRPKNEDMPFPLPKDPHFTFHAMVKLATANYLSDKVYDPSYGKRLKDNQSSYPDYPYTNSDLKFKKVINLNGPGKAKFKKKNETIPFVVRAWDLADFCLPNNGRVCGTNTVTSDKVGLRRTIAATAPLTHFDGRAVATYAVWRPSDGVWYAQDSDDYSMIAAPLGASGDKPTPGDYDGDGETDYAVFRPSTAVFYILHSESLTVRTVQWTTGTDLPVTGDFDGDRKTDVAFYRPDYGSHWSVIRSSDNVTVTGDFGAPEDKPVSGDYDGDGKTDFAVFRPSTGTWWWWSTNDGTWNSYPFGTSGDIPVPGDYNGDGITDFAVYRPSNNGWYVWRSGGGGFWAMGIGQPGDIPVAGDYDGDGKVDVALWTPSTGIWLIWNSETQDATYGYWGNQSFGDIPVAAAFSY